MKQALFFFLLLYSLVCSQNVKATSCRPADENNWIPVVQDYIEKSHSIFIGEVIGKKEEFLVVKVVDVFKGNPKDTILFEPDFISGISDRKLEQWEIGIRIFYIKEILNNVYVELLINSSCGMSRDLSSLYPGVIPPDLPPPPLPSSNEKDKKRYKDYQNEYIIDLQNRKIQLVKNWINEYALLNAYRNNHLSSEPAEPDNKNYLSYLALALSIIAVFIAFFRKQR
ncbi:hypothetical protein [Rufibacter roseus]|uniref:Uncharacterized protein n=1 Tax=Rufibacter roseus TaxID=1567108 RepID=A0ABW2DMN6_9BACT|nr:hypothetical protein [Rufibacter roseus]